MMRRIISIMTLAAVSALFVAADVNAFSRPQIHRAVPFQRKAKLTASKPSNDLSINNIRGGGGNVFSNSYNWYVRQCEVNPYKTKSVTAAIVGTLGDIMAQYIEAGRNLAALSIDYTRLSAFFLCGLLCFGPLLHLWYEQLGRLGRWMEKKYGSSKTQQTIAQLVTDQTFGAITFNSLYFFVFEFFEAAVSMRTPNFTSAYAKFSQQIVPVLLMQYRIFPLANGINFALVPKSLRVLYSNLIGVAWSTYLCAMIAVKG